MPRNPPPPPARRARRSLPVGSVLLLLVLSGCGGNDPRPAARPGEPAAPRAPVDRPAAAPPVRPGEEVAPVAPAVPIAPPASGDGAGYAAGLRARMLAGDAAAVRESLPPGALAAVDAVRRALVRAAPDRRRDALAALAVAADVIDRNGPFLAATTAVSQGRAGGVRAPGWVPPVLRAVAAGPAADGDPEDLTTPSLLDGTVAVLLADETFRDGLRAWTVAEDVPAVPPGDAVAEDGEVAEAEGEEVTGAVTFAGPDGAKAPVPVVASGGRWVPVVVEATLPVWAARADSAGGTGAAAALAAALPHLENARDATTQATFDAALTGAFAAALAATAGPPAPVTDAERVTVELTRPLTARQVADLLPVLEAATDAPARAVSRAAPRPNDPGWTVSVGPVGDPAAFLARLPVLAGATAEGRTLTAAYAPPAAAAESADGRD